MSHKKDLEDVKNLDVVTRSLIQMRGLVQSVEAVAGQTVEVYEQDEVLKMKGHIKGPAVGILYNGFTPQTDRSGTGLVPTITVDLFVCGGSTGHGPRITHAINAQTIVLLGQLRDAVKLEQGPGHRPWRFETETPVDLGDNLAYLQRWSTVIPILNKRSQ